jgi:ketosteroid isomerase-like protein
VFVLLAAGASPAQAGAPNADADAIRAADAAWFAAELRRDVEAIMPFVADAAVFQPPDTPAFVGSDAVRKFYRAFFELPFTDVGGSSDSIIVASSGDLAYDVGRNYVVLRGPEGQRRYEGKYLAVWRKTGTSWKVTAISWSLDAPMR